MCAIVCAWNICSIYVRTHSHTIAWEMPRMIPSYFKGRCPDTIVCAAKRLYKLLHKRASSSMPCRVVECGIFLSFLCFWVFFFSLNFLLVGEFSVATVDEFIGWMGCIWTLSSSFLKQILLFLSGTRCSSLWVWRSFEIHDSSLKLLSKTFFWLLSRRIE